MNKNLEELQNIASKNWLYFYVAVCKIKLEK